ncbi:MAG: xanthine dehydrogenase accessory protein XdhC [Pseudomonadota bacterium]
MTPIESWQTAISELSGERTDHVLVTVLATSGSAPRPAGTKMVVCTERTFDTIGGGQLEYEVIQAARRLLQDQQGGQVINHYPLAASVAQCCGGSVTVLFESFVYQLKVAIFGAGFVGHATAGLLHELAARVRLLDTRGQLPEGLDMNYERFEDARDAIQSLSPDTHVLIMTHSHELDYALVQTCLEQQRISIGLIGSSTKWERFKARLIRDGFDEGALARVRSPLGVPDIKRKEPLAVAIAIVAQLLQLETITQTDLASLSWRQVKASLVTGTTDD